MRFGVHLAALAIVAGCGVPAEKHEEIVRERDELEKRVDTLEKELEAVKKKSRDTRKRSPRKRPERGPLTLATEENIEEWLGRAKISRDSKLGARLKTNRGDIACTLFPDKSPLTVASFVGLAEGTFEWKDPKTGEMVKGRPLYDGVIFHRVIGNFMIQGGDPLGTGTGGPGYRFDDEVDNGLKFDEEGLLAMANAGPKTNGSQFFITTSTPAHLNGKHTIFGKCEMDTVQKIASTPVAARSKPVEDVVIEHIEIERK